MTNVPQRPRGKRLLALAAVVIGGVLLAQRFILGEPVDELQLAARAEPSEQPKRVERASLESKPSPVPPSPSLPSSIGPTTSAEPLSESGTAPKVVSREVVDRAPTTSSPSPPAAPVRQQVQRPAPSKPAPQRVARTARSEPASRDLKLATEEPSWDLPPSSKQASKVPEGEQPGAPVPAPSGGAAAAEPTKEPAAAPAARPVASPDVPSSDAPSGARVFANEQAQRQLAAAANEASLCASLGSTRGSGQVNVSIATWGRVVRVTHLNQAFVGTPVGVCVMEVFQKVQVPPFDGATQTVTSSFLIQ